MAQNLSFEQTMARFETLYMASGNLAERTRQEYRRDIGQFIDHAKGQGISHPAEIELEHLQAFMARLDTLGRAGSTRRRKAAALRTFFGFLVDSELIPDDPTARLKLPPSYRMEPRFLSETEYNALLRACAHHTRDAAIIELILQTGLRVSEVARLKTVDVELPARITRDPANTGHIHIRAKGGKERVLPLNYKACRALRAYLRIRPRIPERGLFVTKFRKPMGARAIQRMIAKYFEQAGIEGASVHTLRHTFATHHAARGTTLRVIQDALGHADLKTTSIYVGMAKSAMRRDLQQDAL